MGDRWARFKHKGNVNIGKLISDSEIEIYSGNLFNNPSQTGEILKVGENLEFLAPCIPSKMIALWNNYKALADEKGLSYPDKPLYIFKSPSSFSTNDKHIYHPRNYKGEVFFEGELGIVIGQPVKDLSSLDDAKNSIFGYTCINDVTAFGLLKDDPNFDQWTRSKGFDGFGDPKTLNIQTIINDSHIVQDYPVSDMIFSCEEIVMYLSQNMTLFPGDIICVGTSQGLGPMERDSAITVRIDGIGDLNNTYG